jgi:hypothetical protein
LQTLLRVAVDLVLSGSPSLLEPARGDLAGSLAALIVGLPLWVLAWRPLVLEAALDGELGDHARRSPVRKGYLFLILFVGVLGVMFGAGMLLYQVLSALFDEPSADLLRESAQALKTLLLFAILLIYHWQALRADGRLSGRSLARRHAQFPVLVLAPENGDFAYLMVTALQNAAAGLPVAIHSYSQGVPDETLSAAKAVILPAELVARPSEALRLWLQGFAGVRLVVPSPVRDWHWIFSGSQSLPALARRTAGIVRRLAEGEELDALGEISSGLVLVYILAGLAALQIVLGIIGVVFSLFFR